MKLVKLSIVEKIYCVFVQRGLSAMVIWIVWFYIFPQIWFQFSMIYSDDWY